MTMGPAKMSIPPRDGETWIDPVSGQEYKWRGSKGWVATGRFPLGANPIGAGA